MCSQLLDTLLDLPREQRESSRRTVRCTFAGSLATGLLAPGRLPGIKRENSRKSNCRWQPPRFKLLSVIQNFRLLDCPYHQYERRSILFGDIQEVKEEQEGG